MLELLSKTVILPTSFTMLLLHPYRKQQTPAAMMRSKRKKRDHWWWYSTWLRCLKTSERINIRVVFKYRQTLPQHRPGSRLHYCWVNNPMGYIVSPAAVAGLQLERLDRDADKAKVTPGCLEERDDRKVRYRRAHMGESPPNPLAEDRSCLQNMFCTSKRHPQGSTSTWRTGSLWMLGHSDWALVNHVRNFLHCAMPAVPENAFMFHSVM